MRHGGPALWQSGSSGHKTRLFPALSADKKILTQFSNCINMLNTVNTSNQLIRKEALFELD
jgi:hypothetical protein